MKGLTSSLAAGSASAVVSLLVVAAGGGTLTVYSSVISTAASAFSRAISPLSSALIVRLSLPVSLYFSSTSWNPAAATKESDP